MEGIGEKGGTVGALACSVGEEAWAYRLWAELEGLHITCIILVQSDATSACARIILFQSDATCAKRTVFNGFQSERRMSHHTGTLSSSVVGASM